MSEQQIKKLDWSAEKIGQFQTTFLTWYQREKRDLPWRENHNPYRIWISEIMLQQTQVNTVIPYFKRFMTAFPTLHDLAHAPEDRLLKAWEGLGYYSRARNLKIAALQVEEEFGGEMPKTAELLSQLKGIGPYTSGAVASIAFNQAVPAVDGNAMRVVSRLFEIEQDIAEVKTRKIFEKRLLELIPENHPGDFNQALMDLGSQICMPKVVLCEECPLQGFCQSYERGTQLNYPVKKKKIKQRPVHYAAIVLKKGDQYLLTKRPSTGLLANLWTFPLIETDDLIENEVVYDDLSEVQQNKLLAQQLQQDGLEGSLIKLPRKPITHVFSHLKWFIQLYEGELGAKSDLRYFPGEFFTLSEIKTLAEPTVQKKLWKALNSSEDSR